MMKPADGLGLPRYHNTKRQQEWVAGKERTASLVRSLWAAARPLHRQDPVFLALLTQCGWTNVLSGGKGHESTITWRNRNIADYLGVSYESESKLATQLAYEFTGLT